MLERNSIFDAPPLKKSERKAYNAFAKRMNDRGYTEQMMKLLMDVVLNRPVNKPDFDKLLTKIRLEELGIDSTKVDYPTEVSR